MQYIASRFYLVLWSQCTITPYRFTVRQKSSDDVAVTSEWALFFFFFVIFVLFCFVLFFFFFFLFLLFVVFFHVFCLSDLFMRHL